MIYTLQTARPISDERQFSPWLQVL